MRRRLRQAMSDRCRASLLVLCRGTALAVCVCVYQCVSSGTLAYWLFVCRLSASSVGGGTEVALRSFSLSHLIATPARLFTLFPRIRGQRFARSVQAMNMPTSVAFSPGGGKAASKNARFSTAFILVGRAPPATWSRNSSNVGKRSPSFVHRHMMSRPLAVCHASSHAADRASARTSAVGTLHSLTIASSSGRVGRVPSACKLRVVSVRRYVRSSVRPRPCVAFTLCGQTCLSSFDRYFMRYPPAHAGGRRTSGFPFLMGVIHFSVCVQVSSR